MLAPEVAPFPTSHERRFLLVRVGFSGPSGDARSLDCARDDRLFRDCTSEDARAYICGASLEMTDLFWGLHERGRSRLHVRSFAWLSRLSYVADGTRTGVSAPHDLGGLGTANLPASSYFRSECCSLVESLVSHLSAKNAERWGTLFLGGGWI
jgi:hypothetical protein